MLRNEDVVSQGFKPLKKVETEPVQLPSKPMMNRGVSFNAATGEKESSQTLWEGSSWEKFGRSRGRTMDRANSFVGKGDDSAPIKENPGAVVIVDPFSTGAHLAAAVCKSGNKCIRVFSVWDSPVASLVQKGLDIDFTATVQHNDKMQDQDAAIDETVSSLQDLPFNILAVIPGAETGVELADALSHRMKLRSNGVEGSIARRNKYYMGEKVRNAGVRAVKQAMCTTLDQMHQFLKTLRRPGEPEGAPLKCVVKPVQSAGTDDVFLCSCVDEAEKAFKRILGKVNGIGLVNDCVLVQEYLIGKEYVIDKVSRDGVHKLVAIWEYDKRPVNGHNFVYFGMKLRRSDTDMARVMVAYADQVLNALGIMQGPSHMEVMLHTYVDTAGKTVYDPCLVEVGARCHGGEGTWLKVAKECIGYTKVEVTLDVYLEGKLFESIGQTSYPVLKAGREIDMVSRHGGICRALIGDDPIRALSTFRGINWDVKPGDYVPVTIDCFTRPGCVELVADTEEEVERDTELIHSMENMELIDYAVICPRPPVVGAIVIVDPFSTGANLSAMVLQWGYKLILVFSEMDSPVAKLVSKGAGNINPTLLIQHDSNHPNQDFAIKQTLEAIDAQGAPILAILPGAETGVELADHLATRYGTRNNGEDFTEARRNKYLMQEAIRAAGLRAIQQRLCKSEQEVRDFIAELKATSPTGSTRCVVKPNESAGTDSVHLCQGADDAVLAFKSINGHVNGLGQVNEGALCQEFLHGTEFAIDGVSRDGVYKVTAVWQYDKRSVNGANFVYFGMKMRDARDPDVKAMLEYAAKVVKALHIFQGPSHMEIMNSIVTNPTATTGAQYSPCLVEVGSRCHGGEGTWLPVAQECVGYTQVEAVLSCYMRPDRFDVLPPAPKLLKHGCEAFLVSFDIGTLQDIPGIATIRSLSSFRRMEMLTQPGAFVRPTIDCFTRPGSVQLVNETAEALQKDYDHIRQLEKSGLFTFQS